MMRSARTPIFVILLVSCALAVNSDATPPATEEPNGISVGEPKVFDNRTLTIMLESLSQAFQSIQTQFIDQKAVAAALANVQGFNTSEINRSATLGTAGTPSVTSTADAKTGNAVAASGQALPNSTDLTSVTTKAASTTTPPALDSTIPAFTGFTPTYGQSSADVLSDQVNLSYQIFNLRMILERSLSDRLLDQDPRLQAVLGFNVTIDPPRTAVDAVAVVEVTLRATHPGNLSLVALMPQEKTYNAATLSTSSKAFGGTAVVNAVQVGYNERRRGQTFYLYRDNDTVAYERMDPVNNELIFGWMFRPVLGRRSVSPGFRQMFAIVALPWSDMEKPDDASHALSASVRTFWKKYDGATQTSFEERDANRASRFRYVTTFGLGKPEIFENRYRNHRDYSNIPVKTSAEYDRELGPKVDRVSWTPVGAKSAFVSAVGHNFFTGTQLILGDKTYGLADGLVLKSNKALELVTSLDALSQGPAVISGRYGQAVPLVNKSDAEHPLGIELFTAFIGPPVGGTRTVTVKMRSRENNCDGQPIPLTLDSLPRSFRSGEAITPLITVNGSTVPLPYQLSIESGNFVVQGLMPDSLWSNGGNFVKTTWPFLPSNWTTGFLAANPANAYHAVRVDAKSFVLLSSDEKAGFVNDPRGNTLTGDTCWTLLAGGDPIKLNTCVCKGDEKQTTEMSHHAILVTTKGAAPDKVVLFNPTGAEFEVDVPKLAAAQAAAKAAAATKDLTVNQYDSVIIPLTVADASKVASVSANEVKLDFKPASTKSGETKLNVQLTRDLTSSPGNVDLSVLDASGKVSVSRLVITPCAKCKLVGSK
jgi:hypothetical protein